MQSLDYKDLEVLAVVVEEGSIRAAALELNLSEPSVSRRMSRLEHTLGVPLLDRSTRGVVPTPAGKLLLPYIERGKDLLDEMFAAMNQSSSATRLSVWTDATLAPVVMSFLCRSLVDPVELSNRVASPEKVLSAILHGAADVAFAPRAPCPDSVSTIPFFGDVLAYVVHPDHPLTSLADVGLEDLSRHPVAVVDWGARTPEIASQLLATGIAPDRLRSVTPGSTAAMLSLYCSHVGVSIRSSLAPAISEGLLVELPPENLPSLEVVVELMYRRSDAANPGIQAVRAAVEHAWGRRTLCEAFPASGR